MVAAETKVEVMTVERNGSDLVFTPSSLLSAETSDGQNGQIRQKRGRRKNRDIESVRDEYR